MNILIYKISKIDLDLETFSILLDQKTIENKCNSLYETSKSINKQIKDSVKVLYCSKNAVNVTKLLEDDIGNFCNELKDLHRTTFKDIILGN